jgi:hypothetical protein
MLNLEKIKPFEHSAEILGDETMAKKLVIP